jgi:purine-binding chemotaxis protein CheW
LENRVEILIFDVAGQRYALGLAQLREVVQAVAITPLPGAPRLVEGVIDRRGSLVPVIEVRRRLGLATKPVDAADHLIIAEAAGQTVALRVDGVNELREIDEASMASASELAPEADTIVGIARLPDGVVLVQDLGRFLSAADAKALAGALGALGVEAEEG